MFEAQKKTRGLDDDFKRKIIAELINTGSSAASLARRHNINASQIYKWKKIYGSEAGFLPVTVSKPVSPAKKRNNSIIKITLANGSSIAFEGGYDLNDITQLAQSLSS